MSTLTKVLERNIKVIEKNADLTEGRFRLGHHLMPPVGWLNDPNGLCWYKGKYHVFFQYAPFDVEGGLKFWGHYTSEDLVDWKYEGTALYPDSPYDCHGVYSGSALAESEKLHLFFTGNVKIDGDYDYINEGRETSTLHVESEDGIHFGDKEEIISFEKYPEEFTCHIRDPKVWKENDRYFMVLGGRLKGDKGAVLVYESENLKEWKFKHIITTPEAFGYMWECPDYFELDGKKFLSVSPQGLKREEFRFQNIYQSGYFQVKEDGSVDERDFREWDMGFDFYAPQTFTDNSGRRLLIGWMGMPDAEEEYTNKTIDEGWQHCLTVPRELRVKDGKIFQYPAKELERLRKEKTILDDEKSIVEVRVEVNEGFEGSTKNIIKMQENCIDITKKGVSNEHMVFEKNRKNMSYYGTPFGNLLVGIDAKDIKVEETEHCIDVQIDYALEVNYEHLADCTIKMKIASKEKGEFSLA